ncbi:MAG: helix-turn-helix domain-containing protein [Clostridium sp.]
MVKNKLKEIRMVQYQISQKEFAKILGISVTTYNSIETNKVQGNIENILKITKALNLKVDEIWYLED